MIDNEILTRYFNTFKIESNMRLTSVPGSIPELPMHIYKGAHEQAKKEILEELSLDNKVYGSKFDEIYDFFKKNLIESDHFGKAETITSKAIAKNHFNNN